MLLSMNISSFSCELYRLQIDACMRGLADSPHPCSCNSTFSLRQIPAGATQRKKWWELGEGWRGLRVKPASGYMLHGGESSQKLIGFWTLVI